MKKWHWGVAISLVIAVVVGASVATSGPRGEKVYVEPAKRRDIEAIVSAPGEIDPKVKVNISAHVIGKIERLHFKEGDTVTRGQRLVDLERAAYLAQRDRALADLANRRIEVQRARTNLANAELLFRRATSLREQGIQAEELLDRARLDLANARSTLQSTQEGVRQAEAILAQANDDLSRTTILAPISGRVVQLNAQEGEVVITGTMNNPGSVIAILADLSEILVNADVAETEVVRVEVGDRAKVEVDAVPDYEYEGVVAEIGSSAGTRPGSTGLRFFSVKIGLLNADERLRPGMTAQVDIVTEAVEGALSVPVQSVVERSAGELKRAKKKQRDSADDDSEAVERKKYVFVVGDGKAEAVAVETGISNATHVAIVAGLEGERDVITGPFRTLRDLRNGTAVQVEKETSKARKASSEAKDDS